VPVTGISPTAAGEGKITIIGLGAALNRVGRRTMICLQKPSLGPCFGAKGGATGRRAAGNAGGRGQPALHRRLPCHHRRQRPASGAGDNHLHWGNALEIDPRRVTWRRALDMNDRALRALVYGLGGTANGVPREDGFDITADNEVMTVFRLAR